MIIEEKERAAAIAGAARATKRKRTWEKCPKRSAEDESRERKVHRGRRADGKDARGRIIRRNGAKESVLGHAIDETRGKERARVGIKWGGLLISLAIHPQSVVQDYPEGSPTLNPALWIFSPRRWRYPSSEAGRASGAWQRESGEKKKEKEERSDWEGRREAESPVRGQGRVMFCVRPISCTYVSSHPIVASATRDGPIFFALIRSPTETTRTTA